MFNLDIIVDGEGNDFEKTIINDKDIYFSYKNGMNNVVFNNEDYGYKLVSEISIEELKK